MTKSGRPSKYKLQVVQYLACHSDPLERTIRLMTDGIAGRRKSISSLQRSIARLSDEGIVDSRNERVKIPQRRGHAVERSVIAHYLKNESWLDVFILFFSNDNSLEDDWREWQKASSVDISPILFRLQRRFEFLNSSYGRRVISKNFRELMARVELRWFDLLGREYFHEFQSEQSSFYSALDTYTANQRASILALNGLFKVKRIGKFRRKPLRIPRYVVKESNEEVKVLTTLIRLSPSAVEYIMRQDPGNEVVPSFILDLKRFIDDCVEQNMPPEEVPRLAAEELGNSFRRVLMMMMAHDAATLPPELVNKVYDVEDREMLNSLMARENLALVLQPQLDGEIREG